MRQLGQENTVEFTQRLAKRDCRDKSRALKSQQACAGQRGGQEAQACSVASNSRENSSPLDDSSPTSQRPQDTLGYVNHLFGNRILSGTSEQVFLSTGTESKCQGPADILKKYMDK